MERAFTRCVIISMFVAPYVVRELKIADYLFFTGDKLAPILIERKTAENVLSSSLHDGRWERQQRAMRKAQFILGGGPERRCQIVSTFLLFLVVNLCNILPSLSTCSSYPVLPMSHMVP